MLKRLRVLHQWVLNCSEDYETRSSKLKTVVFLDLEKMKGSGV